MESSFRAARDGMQSTLLHRRRLRPAGEIAHEVMSEIRPLARELNVEAALDEVHWLLETGGGAGRHRRVVAERGMTELLALLVAETSRGE